MAQARKPLKKPAGDSSKTAKLLKPNPREKLIQDVTNRYRVTAREARDIVTAVGTAATSASSGFFGKKSLKNVERQIKETVKAAKTGERGTTSDIARKNAKTQVTSGITGKSMGTVTGPGYQKGKQR